LSFIKKKKKTTSNITLFLSCECFSGKRKYKKSEIPPTLPAAQPVSNDAAEEIHYHSHRGTVQENAGAWKRIHRAF